MFYMDVVVAKRNQESGQWETHYEVKEFFVGSHAETRSEFYVHEGRLYALVQTVVEGRGTLWRLDVEGKSIEQFSENKPGESVSILAFDPKSNLLVAKLSTINELTLCYSTLPQKLQKIPALATEPDFTV